MRGQMGMRTMLALSALCAVTASAANGQPAPVNRVEAAQKGSVLVWPAVEIKWDVSGNVIKDTFIELTNDYPGFINVHMYFVNGDQPIDAVMSQGQLIERAHPGWNNTNCIVRLTPDQPTYWSALTGLPVGCQPFTALDGGLPPGRLDVENPPNRVLRGFIVAIAVDGAGLPCNWNHLSGGALHMHYAAGKAWEYNAYAFQAVVGLPGTPIAVDPTCTLGAGIYEPAFDKLLLEYYATGSFALSGAGRLVQIDTDLTLLPLVIDLRQDTCGPVRTKADFVIHNMNEVGFSGTERCISCWDQTLFSRYARNANYLLRSNVQTDKAKARIDGVGSQVCDEDPEYCGPVRAMSINTIRPECPWSPMCAIDVALLGVQNKALVFTDGAAPGVAFSGTALVGQGIQGGSINFDIPTGPQPVVTPGDIEAVDGESTVTPRSLRSVKGGR